MADEQLPPGLPEDAEMIEEGSPKGGPSVRFDPVKRQNYHLGHQRQRIYHDVPDGFALDDTGAPIPLVEGEPMKLPDGHPPMPELPPLTGNELAEQEGAPVTLPEGQTELQGHTVPADGTPVTVTLEGQPTETPAPEAAPVQPEEPAQEG